MSRYLKMFSLRWLDTWQSFKNPLNTYNSVLIETFLIFFVNNIFIKITLNHLHLDIDLKNALIMFLTLDNRNLIFEKLPTKWLFKNHLKCFMFFLKKIVKNLIFFVLKKKVFTYKKALLQFYKHGLILIKMRLSMCNK